MRAIHTRIRWNGILFCLDFETFNKLKFKWYKNIFEKESYIPCKSEFSSRLVARASTASAKTHSTTHQFFAMVGSRRRKIKRNAPLQISTRNPIECLQELRPQVWCTCLTSQQKAWSTPNSPIHYRVKDNRGLFTWLMSSFENIKENYRIMSVCTFNYPKAQNVYF